jgi:glutathione S-transferase
MKHKVTCYIASLCPFAQRTRITILAKQIPHQFIDLGNEFLLDSSQKAAILKEKNPLGAVPVIEHEGLTLYESSLIGQYLEEAFPDKGDKLMPDSAKERAFARLLMLDCDKVFVPAFYSVLLNKDESKTRELTENFIEALKYVEERFKMTPGAYFLGKNMSLVDISYVPLFERIVDVLLVFRSDMGQDLLSRYAPNLDVWYNHTMQNVEAFQLTKSNAEELQEFYRKYIDVSAGEVRIA